MKYVAESRKFPDFQKDTGAKPWNMYEIASGNQRKDRGKCFFICLWKIYQNYRKIARGIHLDPEGCMRLEVKQAQLVKTTVDLKGVNVGEISE